jgi:hypothetical protein
MRTRVIAIIELVLIFPAALFMTALVVRNLHLPQYQPAHIAQQLVMWYAARMWTPWVLLLLLPFAVLVTGCDTLLRSWNRDTEAPDTPRRSPDVIRTHFAMLFVAGTTLTAAGILTIVVLHMLAN